MLQLPAIGKIRQIRIDRQRERKRKGRRERERETERRREREVEGEREAVDTTGRHLADMPDAYPCHHFIKLDATPSL